MADKIYPKGVTGFDRHEKAPNFVIGTLIIEPRKLVDWLTTDEGKACLKDYNGNKQLKLQILKGTKGNFLNFQVDTYESGQKKEQPKVENKPAANIDDDLPF